MPVNAPKVLLRSEDSGGPVAVIELTGSAKPPLPRRPRRPRRSPR
jgi:hypothetical protein